MNPSYWITEEDHTLQHIHTTLSTPDLSAWHSPTFSAKPNTFVPLKESKRPRRSNGDKHNGLVTSTSMAPVVAKKPVGKVKKSMSHGDLKSPPLRPSRVAPPPPRDKRGKVSPKHKSEDNDYELPEIVADYQNVHQFVGPSSAPSSPVSIYQTLNVHLQDKPSHYATPLKN